MLPSALQHFSKSVNKGDLVLKVEECWARKQGQLELHCFYYNKKKGKVETKNKVIQDEKERMRIQIAAQN